MLISEWIINSRCPVLYQDRRKGWQLRIGLNTNFYDCLVDEDFDIEPDCDILTGNVIFVYESPGERSIFLRNVIAAGMLVLVVACCCCVAACVFGCYCCFIRRRKRKLLQGSIRWMKMRQETSIDGEKVQWYNVLNVLLETNHED